MQAAPPLLSFVLILLYHSGWTYGLCTLKNSTSAWCDQLEDLKHIETHDLESLSVVPVAQDVLVPNLFDNLTSLRHLDLSDGDLKKIEPRSFRALSNLKSLNLGDNHIEYLELASLEGLTHLRSLNLRRNAIQQLPPTLARLKNLKHLDIHGNPLECNCATLKVRDLITQRGVTISKKVVCAGPGNMKGTSLMKPTAAIICSFEQQDREMQNDQAVGSGDADLGSGDVLDEFNEEDEEENEYVTVGNSTSEKSREPEVETPFPTVVDPTTESSTSKEITAIDATTSSLQHSSGEDYFFDNEDKKEQISTTEMSGKKEDVKDALFYPTEGSGDEDEGSGEGSGVVGTHDDEEEPEKTNTDEGLPFLTKATSIWESLVNTFTGSSATTSSTKEPDLEDEQFINVSSTEEPIVPIVKDHSVESDVGKTATEVTKIIPSDLNVNDVVVLKPSPNTNNDSKSGNIMDNNEQAVASPKQPKKGMGSYVVLAVLLAIVAALIGFAAYRGEICRKRKPPDVETGTEMKEIQKSLLEHGENSIPPKKDENTAPYVTELESAPLVKAKSDDAKVNEIHDDDYQTQETPRVNGTVDHSEPVKPPRKQLSQDENTISQDDEVREERPRVDVNSLKKNFLEDRNPQPSTSLPTTNGPTSDALESNGPPLSPGAQRVKITLQEIPDSVPKTPILITRTMAGENLVKTP